MSRSQVPVTLTATATATWLAFAASEPAAAQAVDRVAREAFLREASVVGQEVIATGITLPERLELEKDGVRRRAAFKNFEIVLENQPVTVVTERQEGLRDSWKFEVAAYELDKLLGLGMVPVTVVRRIGEHEGAVIDWVDDVLPDFETAPTGFDMKKWEQEVQKAWLFDYLAYNIDRTVDNLLVTEGFEIRLIDHSRAFQRLLVPMRPLLRFPKDVVANLRAHEEQDFENALGPYLTDEELDALLERRKRVLEHVDDLLKKRPESDVFF